MSEKAFTRSTITGMGEHFFYHYYTAILLSPRKRQPRQRQ